MSFVGIKTYEGDSIMINLRKVSTLERIEPGVLMGGAWIIRVGKQSYGLDEKTGADVWEKLKQFKG